MKDYKTKLRAYYQLTKPGIIRGNAYAATAGFFLALDTQVYFMLYFYMIVGISMIIGSACVVNNYIDLEIDSKMKRTKKRALVTGSIDAKSALYFAGVIGVVGMMLIGLGANILTALIALTGFIFYVVVYAVAKRRTKYGTVVGSISGAIPPVVGYCAVSNRLDLGALLFFLILVVWQMPHFYAIAMYRIEDYKAARLPVLPIVSGIQVTRRHILAYIAAYIAIAPLLSVAGYAGWIYGITAFALGIYWLTMATKKLDKSNMNTWSRNVFGVSLIVLSVSCGVIVFEKVLAISS